MFVQKIIFILMKHLFLKMENIENVEIRIYIR